MQECIQALSGACSDVAQGLADISLSYHFSLNVSFPTLKVFFFSRVRSKGVRIECARGLGNMRREKERGGVQEDGDVESD